jgi:hypothetical protein
MPTAALFPAGHPAAAARPHPEARFWDRIAERYAAKPVDDPAAYAVKLGVMRDLLFAMPDAQVVEMAAAPAPPRSWSPASRADPPPPP